MEILWWLAPATVATLAAIGYVSWVGQRPPVTRDRSDAAQERMGAALQRPLPTNRVRPQDPTASSGVVVHPPRRSA
ncbi:MAG TPA: hypothetical protein PLC19_06750 [Marmoricola sp.]|nr:hypothetical protein [Marmoricola sp.]